jgi:hypothetical protein
MPEPLLPIPGLPGLDGLVEGLAWSLAAGGVPAPGAVGLGARSVCAQAAPVRPRPITAAVARCLVFI